MAVKPREKPVLFLHIPGNRALAFPGGIKPEHIPDGFRGIRIYNKGKFAVLLHLVLIPDRSASGEITAFLKPGLLPHHSAELYIFPFHLSESRQYTDHTPTEGRGCIKTFHN